MRQCKEKATLWVVFISLYMDSINTIYGSKFKE